MERLWAPWRMEYIASPRDRDSGGGSGDPAPSGAPACIFCAKPAEHRDRENLIVHRGPTCFVILNAYPYNNGHLMAVPYRHVSRLSELTVDENAELMAHAALMTDVLREVSRPDGYNIGMNLGEAAGAGIADHLHLHVVPRWGGDTNFMPVVGDVKVMPESLDQVHAKLARALAARDLAPADLQRG
jgi:ATP adenylyltransferase